MKHSIRNLALAIIAVAPLWGCSPDTLGAAATSATAAAQQAKQAQQEKAIVDQKLQRMQDAMQQHQRDMIEQTDHPPGERGSQ